ncbi:MAG: PH domain-containing protein [Candidatus Moraniibacteriota bacterium]
MHKFEKFHFHGQHNEEVIIAIIRRHWFNILEQYFIIIGVLVLMIAALEILPRYYMGEIDLPLFFFIESFLAITIWIYAFIIWIDFYFDVWIITNERIVNIEQKALFIRTISELKFEKIQDVSINIVGLIPTILNYGDVHVQTAGTTERFLFHKVPDPQKIKGLVMNMQVMTAKRDEAEAIHRISPLLRGQQ